MSDNLQLVDDEYNTLALRTLSDSFYGDRYPVEALEAGLSLIEEQAGTKRQGLDGGKRVLFYGDQSVSVDPLREGDVTVDSLDLSSAGIDLLHALLGIVTEAGEVAGALRFMLAQSGTFDLVNVSEELGDINWYLALAYRALQELKGEPGYEAVAHIDFGETATRRRNLAKLVVRYPGKFTELQAQVRDLEAELAKLST